MATPGAVQPLDVLETIDALMERVALARAQRSTTPESVSADEILGIRLGTSRNGAATQDLRLLHQFQALGKLPKRDQQAVIRTTEAFLAKAGRAIPGDRP